MARQLRYPEYRNSLEATKYPFADYASLQNSDGTTVLEGALLDAHLYPIGGGERMYLSKVIVTHDIVTIYIGDGTTDELASGSYYTTDVPDLVSLVDSYGRPAGVLISESVRIALFQTWGIGTHSFDQSATEFSATCCMPTPEIGVRGIQLEDGSLFTGQIWMVGDDGVVLRAETLILPGDATHAARAVDVVRVDIVGDPLFRRRLCGETNLFETPNPIRVLRIDDGYQTFDCTPDAYGNFTIQMNDNLSANTVLRIRPDDSGLRIEAVGSLTTGLG